MEKWVCLSPSVFRLGPRYRGRCAWPAQTSSGRASTPSKPSRKQRRESRAGLRARELRVTETPRSFRGGRSLSSNGLGAQRPLARGLRIQQRPFHTQKNDFTNGGPRPAGCEPSS